VVDVKFCGLTRPEDAAEAAELGARWLGVIFAGGPRRLEPVRARQVLAAAPAGAGRVGVFGASSPEQIARMMDEARLDVAQLHADPSAEVVHAVRKAGVGLVWAVVRVAESEVPPALGELFDAADAVVLDARAESGLGGSGRSFDWAGVRGAVLRVRGTRPLVLAGGLTPEKVGEGIAQLAPRIVDVSSGVESAPGIKDHARMRAFVAAVAAAR
jgi:phosphoribosylanthranilate isomerase